MVGVLNNNSWPNYNPTTTKITPPTSESSPKQKSTSPSPSQLLLIDQFNNHPFELRKRGVGFIRLWPLLVDPLSTLTTCNESTCVEPNLYEVMRQYDYHHKTELRATSVVGLKEEYFSPPRYLLNRAVVKVRFTLSITHGQICFCLPDHS